MDRPVSPCNEAPECPECGGTGEVWYDALDWRNEHTTVDAPCPICFGTGEGRTTPPVDVDDEDAYERVAGAA